MAGAGVLAGAATAVSVAPAETVTPPSVEVAAPTPSTPRVEGTWRPAQPRPKASTPAAKSDVQGETVVSPPASPPPAPAPSPTSFLVADAAVPSVELFGPGGAPAGRALPNPTKYDLPLVFRVMAEHGEWLDVQVPSRPNGMRAFIRRSDVLLRTVPNWIKVELSTRKVTVFHGDTPLMETIGTIGKPTTPTPTGWFYVDASVILTDPTGPYGTGQLALSGFSDVLRNFAGGEGQIALHGTDAPEFLGWEASNGCVRLENGTFLRVQELAPTGTPVHIVP
jgi:lipoprotein-anchoring transpeptidase ErfK/SrfK